MELTRKQVIDLLEKADSTVYKEPKTKLAQALEYAISSIKTDEMYQLDYEGIQNVVVTEGMTNGELIKHLYPDLSIITDTLSAGEEVVVLQSIGTVMVCLKDWWNSPYKGVKEDIVPKYEYHTDHTDCIWYGSDGGCPVTCSQYRDGWNDAMEYIFKGGKGYNPYRRENSYEV